MDTLEVVFEVPAQIHIGMTNGSLERIGGVVRDTRSKQVVAWLRDGALVSETSNPVDRILNASAGKHLLSVAGRSTLLLSLALMTLGIMRIDEHLDVISHEIASIKDEFKRDRLAKRRVALRAARDVLTVEDTDFIRARFNSAQDGLYEAQQQLLLDMDAATEVSNKIALLTQAMDMLTLRARCYLRLEQRHLALQDLKADTQLFEARTGEIIQLIVGPHPALFLHASSSDEVVDRFIALQLWHRDQPHTLEAYRVLLHEMRQDFWNTQALSVLDSRNTLERIQGFLPGRLKTQETGVHPLEQRLELAEIARENLERLKGFQLEVHEVRLASIAQWETPSQQEDMNFQALIVDREALENLAR